MKKFMKFLGGVFLTAVLILGLAIVMLIRPGGLEVITPWLTRQIEEATGLNARIEGLQWVYPMGIQGEMLSISGGEEEGAAVQNFSLRVSSRRLLRRKIHVVHLRAEAVTFRGLPAADAETAPEDSERDVAAFPELRTLFERVTVEELSLPDIRLLPPFQEEEIRISLAGGLMNQSLDLRAEIDADRFSALQARLRLERSESFDFPQILNVQLELSSTDLSLDGRVDLITLSKGQRIVLHQLEAEAFGHQAVLEEPLILERTLERVSIGESVLRVGEGRFRFGGTVDPHGVDLHADVEDFPLALTGLAGVTDPGAAVAGRITLGGVLNDLTAQISVDFTGLKPEDPDLWAGDPAALRIRGALENGRATLTVRIEDLPGEPVVLDADIPFRLSLQPFEAVFPEDEPVRGRLTAATDLEGLSRLFVLDVYHRLNGLLEVDMHLDGTLSEPRLRGDVQVVDGAYEHELTGFHLRDLAFSLSADRGELRLDTFEARDGREGQLRMSGGMQMARGEEIAFSADLTLQDFQAVRQEELEAVVNGTLRWTGGKDRSLLEGRLALRPVEIRIPEKLPHTVRTIEVVEQFVNDAPELNPEPESPPGRHRLALDLNLDSADRIFVRGRGLDSEWSARLNLRGEVTEPVLTGELSVLRGRFLFFGRRLAITRGRVIFDGAFPPDPVLDVVAELRSGGVLGLLMVSGPAGAPDIELASTPPLPEDEILARLLFGRESARISPWQALTLAQAVNSLRGGGSAFDVMGTTRRMLHVDQIEIRSNEEQEGQTRVAVGRHVGDRIYLELERGAEAESGRARVEVELTPTLRLETQTGTESDSGIGLRWRWDY